MMQAAKRNPVTEFFFRIHPWVYRRTGGRILCRLGGAPILLLNTHGASEISRSSCSSPSRNSQDLEYVHAI